MGQGFKEVANLRTNIKKFEENFSKINWGNSEEKTNDEDIAFTTVNKKTERRNLTLTLEGNSFCLEIENIVTGKNTRLRRHEIATHLGEEFAETLIELITDEKGRDNNE